MTPQSASLSSGTARFRGIGEFDHLVTAAAGIAVQPFAKLDEEDVRQFFEIKFWWGQCRAIRAALPNIATDRSTTLFSGYLYRKPGRTVLGIRGSQWRDIGFGEGTFH